ncbi:MAG: glutathione-dependent disulfide-bond oxidoreductase, partial [Rhodospirillaceae bacterium]|nr:glutathione-dependent disulfide-bond oxidoreductase [Rhodospirillaceae bacterium]
MENDQKYVPEKIWKWDQKGEGKYGKINRPTAGSRIKSKMPVGKHPLQLYSLATPNGVKVTILLEELLALGYSDAEYD